MQTAGKRQNHTGKRFVPGAAILALLVVVGLFAIPAGAWLFFGRSVAAVTAVEAPNSLFISSGNGEDVTYLDMSGINVETAQRYQYFVFSVQGENVSSYHLQLAYTTNNQFSYEIYPAQAGTSGDFQVEYTTHAATPQKLYYKIKPGAAALAGRYLNKDGAAQIANDDMHTHTYGDYDNVNIYNEPIYWQTTSAVEVAAAERAKFIHYFIIKVSWPSGRRNDRESDILYIAASVQSGAGS